MAVVGMLVWQLSDFIEWGDTLLIDMLLKFILRTVRIFVVLLVVMVRTISRRPG